MSPQTSNAASKEIDPGDADDDEVIDVEHDFESTRELFFEAITETLENQNVRTLQNAYMSAFGTDVEKRLAMDQALRDILYNYIVQDKDNDACQQLVVLSVACVRLDTCHTNTPFALLGELFDGITLENCSKIFEYVEDHVHIWKQDAFYSGGKNYLLRMCNDLLRRLSKSQNTLFCGRIQLFLARLLPLDEKSGINLMGQFNIENVTYYNTISDDSAKKRKLDKITNENGMDEGETESPKSSIPIDYNLYKKFWSLQDFFRKPQQCFDKNAWKIFTDYAKDVTECFESYKLDDMKSSKKNTDPSKSCASQQIYFAKYLTSEKLLDLQLSDCNFRRYVLLQFLIIFQYLNAQVKFKVASQVLAEEQSNWIKASTEKVYTLLKETPPDGELFSKSIVHILSREEYWNSWKNGGCPSFVRHNKSSPEMAECVEKCRKRMFTSGSITTKSINIGCEELTKLWNICPNNMEACQQTKRKFIPSSEEFFEEAIEQADPEQQVEEQYKLIHNPTWSWKALKLKARNSPHFFSQSSGTLAKPLPEHLDVLIAKFVKDSSVLNKEANTSQTLTTNDESEVKTEDQDDEDMKDETQDSTSTNKSTQENEILPNASFYDEPKQDKDKLIDKQIIETLSLKLKDRWQEVAKYLEITEDMIQYYADETTDPYKQAQKMFTIWVEEMGNEVLVSELKTPLEKIGNLTLYQNIC